MTFSLVQTFPIHGNVDAGLGVSSHTIDSFFLLELKNIIKRLKHKASDPSGIIATQIQHLPYNMIQQPAHIYNLSLSIGYFPSIFIRAKIIYIHTEIRQITRSHRKLSFNLTAWHTWDWTCPKGHASHWHYSMYIHMTSLNLHNS